MLHTLFVFLFALTVLGKPLLLNKRYDLDCNGTPDWCYQASGTAHCMRTDGSWTAIATSSIIPCPTTSTQTSSLKATDTTTPKPTASVQALSASLSTIHSTTSATTAAPVSAATLPSPAQFKADKGTKWKIELQGNLQFAGPDTSNLNGDKCRTGKIGDKVIWNCGDMMCGDDVNICGFGMGPGFYGTDSVMKVNTADVTLVQNNDLVNAWIDDEPPQSPQWAWGMDTSNVAAINDTHGVAFAWEIWRGASDGSIVNRGNAAAVVTLGDNMPIATRIGPLLTGADKIQLGLLAILRDGNYIYTYSIGGPSKVIVGRVAADESAFDQSKHEFLQYGTSDTWVSDIPSSSTTTLGATTANSGGQFGCSVYGSVFFNTHLQKYVMLCGVFMTYVNMYTSDTPYGPWSAEYSIAQAGDNSGLLAQSYGAHAHPEYSSADGKEWYFSIGPNSVFQVFKITFDY